MSQYVKDIGKYSFPHRMVEKCNALNDEVLTAHNNVNKHRHRIATHTTAAIHQNSFLVDVEIISELDTALFFLLGFYLSSTGDADPKAWLWSDPEPPI
ncbi:hypothetical protein E2C01_043081 [Portunus trituberculatus]|uniref:Uncharacterized protein n=1 Tax=Portunus trituberculatus TaxID=210409 RepID=A0A5B7FWB2_PORTR|nr:hypothetical protein [Portunus trituberculatus]